MLKQHYRRLWAEVIYNNHLSHFLASWQECEWGEKKKDPFIYAAISLEIF